jgi:hypothetical protein
MKKTIRLTESDLVRLVKRVIKEQSDLNVEFDPTKKGSSEPKKGQSINPNKEAFEKIKTELMAFKKPTRFDEYEVEGVPETGLIYNDAVWVQGKGAKATYYLSINDNGSVIFMYETPETKQIGVENGLAPLGRNSLSMMWNEGDLSSNIQKIKNILRNPKIRVAYNYELK